MAGRAVEAPSREPRWGRALWLTLPVLAAVLVSVNTFSGEFVFDDRHQIMENPWVKRLQHLPRLISEPVWAYHTTEPSNYYRPIQMAIYNLLWWVSGGAPFLFHVANALFHVLTTVAVGLLVRRLSGDRLVAACVALLFAVHPVHTEAVAWIACLPELSYSFFFVACLALHCASWAARDSRARLLRAAAVSSFSLAMFSKETGITALIAVGLLELWLHPARRGSTAALSVRLMQVARAMLPYLVAAVAYLVVRWQVVGGVAPLRREGLTALDALTNAPTLFLKYLRVLVYPVGLVAYHVFDPLRSMAESAVWLGFAAVATLAVVALLLAQRRPELGLAAALVAVPLLPVLYVPAVGANAFAERYAYLPVAGGAWLAVAGIQAAAGKLLGRPRAAPATAVAVVLLSAGFAAASIDRNRIWRTDQSLALATIRDEPRAAHMHTLLGNWYERNGQFEEALRAYETGLTRAPSSAFLVAAATTGRLRLHRIGPAAAIDEYRRILDSFPAIQIVWENLGSAYILAGRKGDAEAAFRRAIELDPNSTSAYDGLRLATGAGDLPIPEPERTSPAELAREKELDGIARLRAGRLDEAESLLQEALRLDPQSSRALVELAAVAGQSGDDRRAVDYCRRAIEIDPRFAGAYQQLGISASRLGDRRQAIEAFERAVAIDPFDADAFDRLGRAYALAGRVADARRAFEQALTLQPGHEAATEHLRLLGG